MLLPCSRSCLQVFQWPNERWQFRKDLSNEGAHAVKERCLTPWCNLWQPPILDPLQNSLLDLCSICTLVNDFEQCPDPFPLSLGGFHLWDQLCQEAQLLQGEVVQEVVLAPCLIDCCFPFLQLPLQVLELLADVYNIGCRIHLEYILAALEAKVAKREELHCATPILLEQSKLLHQLFKHLVKSGSRSTFDSLLRHIRHEQLSS
mmetsp:Transcript_46109/g.107235  ORF Transcript_46109/g.107235 Transcript_46109/m.107235 type:complete len:204 (-) Transcript_46109:804-1415(-)